MINIGKYCTGFYPQVPKRETIKLSSFKGKKVLLSFRPLAWSTICSDQMLALKETNLVFNEMNTVALGKGIATVP